MARLAIVTGATSGIGRYVAVGLGKRGYEVITVGRNEEKGKEVTQLLSATGAKSEFYRADFSRLKEVRQFANHFLRKHDRLDLLIHSAGVIGSKKEITEEGLESAVTINLWSRFLLTQLLLDCLNKGDDPRIVNIAGSGYTKTPPDLTNLNAEKSFSLMTHQLGAQAANDVFIVELSRRLKDTNISAVVMNPGMVATEIRREMGLLDRITRLFNYFMMTPEQGAEAPLMLATSPQMKGITGVLYNVGKRIEKPNDWVLDEKFGKEFWELATKMTSKTGLV